MTVRIRLPTALRAYASGRSHVEVAGVATVRDLIRALVAAEPALASHLVDERGELRAFVNVYVNNEDVRTLARDATPVKPGDSVILVPSVAGG